MGEPTYKILSPGQKEKERIIELKAERQDLIRTVEDVVVGTLSKNLKTDPVALLAVMKKKPFGGQNILDNIAIIVSEREDQQSFSFSLPFEFKEKQGQQIAKKIETGLMKLKEHNSYLGISADFSNGRFNFLFSANPPKDKVIQIDESEALNP